MNGGQQEGIGFYCQFAEWVNPEYPGVKPVQLTSFSEPKHLGWCLCPARGIMQLPLIRERERRL